VSGSTKFVPSRDAFGFSNVWPAGPAVVLRTPLGRLRLGDAAAGLCGGMVFAALDYWHAGAPPPAERPVRGHADFGYLVRRLIDSWHLPLGVLRYYRWMLLPDRDRLRRLSRRPARRSAPARTWDREWPRVRAALDAGAPVPLGVVTVASRRPSELAHNHQVLAYGYEQAGGRLVLRVYDPNRGGRDDIAIVVDGGAAGTPVITHNLDLDRPVRGFFPTGYRPLTPPVRDG
jgi:hypothetical protein